MKLRVLLSASSLAWAEILDQEKVDYRVAGAEGISTLPEEPVLILARRASVSELRVVCDFLERGGAVIADPLTGTGLAYPKEFRRIFILDQAVPREWQWRGAAHKKFIFGEVFVTEVGAREPRGVLRRKAVDVLRRAFWVCGLPYVHLWYYPWRYENLFGFRFDLDEYEPDDFPVLQQLADRYAGAVTCMVNMHSYEPHEALLLRLHRAGVEMGSHGFIHHVYQSEAQNRWNLKKAAALLERTSGPVRGFSGPHGTWGSSLQHVLEEMHEYSSEFALDYDNFPFYPAPDGKKSGVLQIPVHPVCEGVFMERHGYQAPMIEQYFQAVLRERFARHEPVFIFGHAERRIGRHPEIVDHLFRDAGNSPKLWQVQMGAFAGWWKKRNAWTVSAEFEAGKISIHSSTVDSDAGVEIVLPDTHGSVLALQAVEGSRPLADFSGAVRYPRVPVETHEELFSHSWLKRSRLALKHGLDWEIKTPVSDYLLESPRDYARAGLRKIHDAIRSLSPHSHRAVSLGDRS